MNYSRFQLIGPSIIFATALSADAAALALSKYPTSEFLWYVNLEWFSVFQRSYYFLPEWLSCAKVSIVLAAPIFVVAWLAYCFELRFLLAVGSNFGFIYAALLCYASSRVGTEEPTASLGFVHLPSGPNLYLIFVLFTGSLLSFALSHLGYVHSIRSHS